MVQATAYEAFPSTSWVPAESGTPLDEFVHSATEALLARLPRCTSSGTHRRWIPRAANQLTCWLSGWARTQLVRESAALTWERCTLAQATVDEGPGT